MTVCHLHAFDCDAECHLLIRDFNHRNRQSGSYEFDETQKTMGQRTQDLRKVLVLNLCGILHSSPVWKFTLYLHTVRIGWIQVRVLIENKPDKDR